MLLEQHPKCKKAQKNEKFPKLVLLSARHESGLLRNIEKVLNQHFSFFLTKSYYTNRKCLYFFQLELMPYDNEYFTLVNDVFKESMNGYFYRGFTILGGSEKKLHFTLVMYKIFSYSYLMRVNVISI